MTRDLHFRSAGNDALLATMRLLRFSPLYLAALLIGIARQADAQDRVLTWPTIDVIAHLDARGRLHVRERQVLKMTGDWNGGERQFNVQFGQTMALTAFVRIDSATHTEHALTDHNIDVVDGYKWFGNSTLRWRSRLPSDPPFDSTTLIYELRYEYGNILDDTGERRYKLAHDFAFADRDSAITHFSVTLTLDSAWRAPADFTGRYEATMLPPGQGYVVTLPLTFVGATLPSSVRTDASRTTRTAILVVTLGGMLLLVGRLYQQAARQGRFAAPASMDVVTPEWLQSQVFAQPPEVVGAAWDNRTDAPEVAALLARLVQEGKLASRVETQKMLMFTRHILHLELKVARDNLQPHERALISKLFFDGGLQTDTDAVKAHYRKSGFDPASVIRSALTASVARLVPGVDAATQRAANAQSRRITLALVGVAVVLLVIGIVANRFDWLAVVFVLPITGLWYLVARALATRWRDAVTHVVLRSAFVLVPLAVLAAVFSWFVVRDVWLISATTLAALAVWLLALGHSLVANARSTQSPERTALRQRLVVARNWFKRELAKPQPQLSDAWYPYLLAFGLGPQVDKWFKSFGALATGTAVSGSSMSSSVGSGSASSGASLAAFGGGGGFSGGGGGMDFGSAVGGMSSSISAPSSSSSGGGGSSSSSSSGGGGGGGW